MPRSSPQRARKQSGFMQAFCVCVCVCVLEGRGYACAWVHCVCAHAFIIAGSVAFTRRPPRSEPRATQSMYEMSERAYVSGGFERVRVRKNLHAVTCVNARDVWWTKLRSKFQVGGHARARVEASRHWCSKHQPMEMILEQVACRHRSPQSAVWRSPHSYRLVEV